MDPMRQGGCIVPRTVARLAGAAARLGFDRWDTIVAAGAGLLGGGIWAQWGATWACMLWGVLLLGMATLHAVRASAPPPREE